MGSNLINHPGTSANSHILLLVPGSSLAALPPAAHQGPLAPSCTVPWG